MRLRTIGLLTAVSALIGVLTTAVVVYALTLGDGLARERVGLPAAFVGYRAAGVGTADPDAGMRLLEALGSTPAAVVVSSASDTGPAAVGVLGTSDMLPLLTGAAREVTGTAPPAAGPRVVLVEGSFTADQLERAGEATFLPDGASVVGTTTYPWLPRDTQHLYDLASGPLPAGDYFVNGPADVQHAVRSVLEDAGHRVEPFTQATFEETLLRAPFTTLFLTLLLGALGCFALLVVNQLTFHRARVDVHRLHGGHAGALLRRLLPLGASVVAVGTTLGGAVVLLLGRGRLDVLGAAVGSAAAWSLVMAVGCTALVTSARAQGRAEVAR